MAKGSKKKYTSKQKRQAEHIEEGYEDRGTGKKEAERRAWATVNKSSGGGKKSGSGRGKKTSKASSRKGGKKGGSKSKSNAGLARSEAKKRGAFGGGGRAPPGRAGGGWAPCPTDRV